MQTVLVEPDHTGHRFQSVALLARRALREGHDVTLLTSEGAPYTLEYANHLGPAAGIRLDVVAPLSGIRPPTRDVARAVADCARTRPGCHVVFLDADHALRRWWWAAWREFRRVPRRPTVTLMLTRYPAHVRLNDVRGLRMRVPKAVLVVLAGLTGTVDRVRSYAGRDDVDDGWLIRRVRDPVICTAHSRDRDVIRSRLRLPPDRRLIGVFGDITPRKNIPFILEAMDHSGVDATLVVAGHVHPDVERFVSDLGDRAIVDDRFLPDDVLDEYVAAVDVVPLPLTLNGPSGIMGKALAAGVPVVTAGSLVREREVAASRGGVATELAVGPFGKALAQVLSADAPEVPAAPYLLVSADEYAEELLGIGEIESGRRRRGRPS